MGANGMNLTKAGKKQMVDKDKTERHLYKGKRIDDGEWVTGYYLHHHEQGNDYILSGRSAAYQVSPSVPIMTQGFEWFRVDPATVEPLAARVEMRQSRTDAGTDFEYAQCPNCLHILQFTGGPYAIYFLQKYCPECGQRIDWGDLNESGEKRE